MDTVRVAHHWSRKIRRHLSMERSVRQQALPLFLRKGDALSQLLDYALRTHGM
jgi:hypothetical protein